MQLQSGRSHVSARSFRKSRTPGEPPSGRVLQRLVSHDKIEDRSSFFSVADRLRASLLLDERVLGYFHFLRSRLWTYLFGCNGVRSALANAPMRCFTRNESFALAICAFALRPLAQNPI